MTRDKVNLPNIKPERILRGGFFGFRETAGELSGEPCLRETILGVRVPVVNGYKRRPAGGN